MKKALAMYALLIFSAVIVWAGLATAIAQTTSNASKRKVQRNDDPREVLQKARDSILRLGALTYVADYRMNQSQSSTVYTGTVAIQRTQNKEPRLQGKFHIDAMTNGARMETYFDGSVGRYIDHKAKKMWEGREQQGGYSIALSSPPVRLLFPGANGRDLLDRDPLKLELQNGSGLSRGQEMVAGTPCWFFDITFSGVPSDLKQERIWIGQSDYLPRKIRRLSEGSGTQTEEWTFSNVKVTDAIDETQFAAGLPNGYTLESFAPQRKLLSNGDDAPPWELADLNGEKHKLSDYLGRVVVLEFWATWCGYCREGMKDLQRLSDELSGKSVVVIPINLFESTDADVKGFLNRLGYSFQTMTGGDVIAEKYRVSSVPATYVIDRNGRVAFGKRGYGPEHYSEVMGVVTQMTK